jgi:hypothetical protein
VETRCETGRAGFPVLGKHRLTACKGFEDKGKVGTGYVAAGESLGTGCMKYHRGLAKKGEGERVSAPHGRDLCLPRPPPQIVIATMILYPAPRGLFTELRAFGKGWGLTLALCPWVWRGILP